MATIAATTDPDIERIARRRAGAKLGWIVHASVFALVNLFGLAIAAATGGRLVTAGTVGWAFGLAIHGLVVLVHSGGLLDSLARRERARLLAPRDPW